MMPWLRFTISTASAKTTFWNATISSGDFFSTSGVKLRMSMNMTHTKVRVLAISGPALSSCLDDGRRYLLAEGADDALALLQRAVGVADPALQLVRDEARGEPGEQQHRPLGDVERRRLERRARRGARATADHAAARADVGERQGHVLRRRDQAGEYAQPEVQPQRGEHDEDRVEKTQRALQHVVRIDFARHEEDQDAGNARFDERVQVPERARHASSPAQPATDQVPDGKLVAEQQGDDRDDVEEHGRREETKQVVVAEQRVTQAVEHEQHAQQAGEDRHAHALAVDRRATTGC